MNERDHASARRYPKRTTGTDKSRRPGQSRSNKYNKYNKKRLRRIKRVISRALFGIALICLVSFLLYRQFSYNGIVRRGYGAMRSNDPERAQSLFDEAMERAPSRGAAYEGLAQLYDERGESDAAERMFLGAIAKENDDIEIYESAVRYFEKKEQKDKIAKLLDQCSDQKVRKKLSDYICDPPVFSLEEGSYDEVKQVTISAGKDDTVYYTTDGSQPTDGSTPYSEPVLLGIGKTVVSAVAYNEQHIPSVPVVMTYDISLPAPEAPVVVPATGEYEGEQECVVQIPAGCSAYYTMDGSEPGVQSTQYKQPVSIPIGQTIFKVIIVNDSTGRASAVTIRNYVCRSTDK